MAKKQASGSSRDKTLLILFAILSIGIIMFLSATDVFTLFSVTGLTLDATNSRGTPDQRGVDASTGQFTGQGNLADFLEMFSERVRELLTRLENGRFGFERPSPENPPQCSMGACSMNPPVIPPTPPAIPPAPPTPPSDPICDALECEPLPDTVTVIDLRDGSLTDVNLVDGVKGGGGVVSSSTFAGGVQEIIRDNLIAHERFHTPANGQTTTGSILLEWGHAGSITVQQFLMPNEYFDWFEFELPQTIQGDGFATFDGISQGEFIYKLTIPRDLIDRNTIIPIRMVIETQNNIADVVTEIQIERPEEFSQTFSVAELFRSIFTEIRVAFA